MDEKKITVIIPAYNAEKFIERAVNSVKEQTYDNWEVVIVENGSTDNTYERCKELSSDSRIKIYQSEKGVSRARNLGIKKATGEWMFFLDADDWLTKDAFSNLVSANDKLDADIVVGRYEHNKIKESEKNKLNKYNNSNEYLKEILLDPTQKCTVKAILFKSELVKKIAFDESLSYAEDSLFLINAVIGNPKVLATNFKIYHVFSNPQSAVRGARKNLEEKYIKAIAKIKKTFKGYNHDIKNEMNAFIFCQLLVVLVNDTFKNNSFFDALKKTKIICKEKPFNNAITELNNGGLSKSKKIMHITLKYKLYLLCGIMIKIRQLVNRIKG